MVSARKRRRSLSAIAVLALLAALVAWTAPAAYAAPAEPTLSAAEVQALIDASVDGRVPGYFKTVLKGSAIENIPVDVVAVTTVGNSSLYGQPPRLLMFEASGAAIDRIGGIASGMSGSPVYVNDGGVDKLVGAVSYGDMFTLHNTGLATPIEYMSAIEPVLAPASVTLALPEPVELQGQEVSAVKLVRDPLAARKTKAAAGTLVASPLASMQAGGVPAGSLLFKSWQKFLGEHGVELRASTLGGGYDPEFETALTGGAAVAALGSRGDLWYGGAGTVTYANGDSLVAFGHPLFWSGPTGMTLTNAWVEGIWPSAASPYKLISPTKPRGTFTQDRSAGIAGRIGLLPEETPVTSRAWMLDEGKYAESTSYLPRWVADNGSWEWIGLPANAAMVAPYAAEDAYAVPGSAMATLTVVVSDGTTSHTIKRGDVYDSSEDIASASGQDLFDLMWQLQSLNAPDIQKAHIVSVDLETKMSRSRRGATVEDVTVPGGMKIGANRVLTTLRLRDGSRQTIESNLVLPKGSSLQGQLVVGAPGWLMDDPMPEDVYFYDMMGEPAESDRTVADVAKDFGKAPKNTELQVAWQSWGGYGYGYGYYGPGGYPVAGASVTTTATTDSYLRGMVAKQTPEFGIWPDKTWVGYGQSIRIRGILYGPSEVSTITVLKRPAGALAATTVAQFKVTPDQGYARIDRVLANQNVNADYFVRYEGGREYLPAQMSFAVKVGAKVGVGASPSRARTGTNARLTATFTPKQTSGKVVFEVVRGGYWREIKTVSAASPTFSWNAPRGTSQVRARWLGNGQNAPSVSAPISVVRW